MDGVLAGLRNGQRARATAAGTADGPGRGGRIPLRGKEFDRRPAVAEIVDGLPTVRHLLAIDHLHTSSAGSPWSRRTAVEQHAWADLVERQAELRFADVPFDHPLWILWSSGTTGVPKGIVQSHGGIVVELLKALGLGVDLRSDDRFFFHTSTSWMVWNLMVGGLLHGATLVLYDGSPTRPDANGVWRVAQQTGATMVGVGAAYLVATEKADTDPVAEVDLSAVRSILQTGSPMPESTWRWVYDRLAPHAWLQSICGGTDICSVLAGGSPLLPVRANRIQCPALGVALAAWGPRGRPLVGQQGELVVTAPLPSMPLYFVGDPENRRYLESYFDVFPGVWRHGDWVTVDADLSVVVSGRSDSTLNRTGVRMGSADIYAVVERLPRISDSLVVGAELRDGRYFMPLFVVLDEGATLDDALRNTIATSIRQSLSPACSGRHRRDQGRAADADGKEAGGSRQAHPPGCPGRRCERRGRRHPSRNAGLVRRLRHRPGLPPVGRCPPRTRRWRTGPRGVTAIRCAVPARPSGNGSRRPAGPSGSEGGGRVCGG